MKKVFKWILISLSGLILTAVILFVGSRLYILTVLWKYVELEHTQEIMVIDGELSESSWALDVKEFYLWDGDGALTSSVPAFQFLRDDLKLYLAASYTLPESTPSPETLNDGSLLFSLKLRPNINGTYYKFRVVFEPADSSGDLSGMLYCDCPKYPRYWGKEITSCEFASTVTDGIWIIEFAIPFSEVISQEDDALWYRLAFANKNLPEELISFYPYSEGSNRRQFFRIES